MKKWTVADFVILFLELVTPILSLVITIVFANKLTEDAKLGIITVGIALPIVLLQFSLTQAQNKNDAEIKEIKNKIEQNDDKITHISPIVERVFLSDNDMIKRFAYRRIGEATKAVNYALTNHRSNNLRPNEYYEELFYLANLIKQDYHSNIKNFSGEIWAMTSFADNEWSADQGYEQRWTEELCELVDQGIKTRRLCIIPDTLYKLIASDDIDLNKENKNNPTFKAFWEFLLLYYKDNSYENVFQYAIREGDSADLTRIRGFFAIKLSNGELHILYGETVDSNGAMTSELLFDRSEIQRARALFERHSNHTIGDFVNKCGSPKFKNALEKHNIKLN